MSRVAHKHPNCCVPYLQHRAAAVIEFLLGDNTAGEFKCSKHLTGAKKDNR